MAMWKNDEEMFALMKEKLYTPVVGDILDQMGYKHQFLPAQIRPLAALAPVQAYIKGDGEDNRLKLAGFACTILENDVFEEPKKPFGYLTEALDQLRGHRRSPFCAVGRASDHDGKGQGRCGSCFRRLHEGYAPGDRTQFPGIRQGLLGAGFQRPDICLRFSMHH